jgi:flagellar hook-associated protein 2
MRTTLPAKFLIMSGIQVSGLLANSAFDWKSIVDQLIAAEGAPITKLNTEKTKNSDQVTALAEVSTMLQDLQDSVQAMRANNVFSARTVASDLATTTWKCSSVTGAATGSYTFDVTQLATQASLRGSSDIGGGLRNAGNSAGVLGVPFNQLALSPAITAGNFTVNGALVTVTPTDSLQDVFDAIATATGGSVTGSYDYATNKVSLSGVSDQGVVGGTSNVVTALKLDTGGTFASSAAAGAAQYGQDAAEVLSLAFSGYTSGPAITAGTFTVNGAPVTVAVTDSLQDVFAAISSATGGAVTGSYDYATDKVSLTGVTTLGDAGDTSSFLTALNLGAGGTYASSAAVGLPLSGPNTPGIPSIAVGDLPLSPVLTAGTFTVNGAQVTVALTDSMQDIFDSISSATGGVVTGSYDYATDKVSLSGVNGAGVVSGTCNLVAALKLSDLGGGIYASSAAVGAADAVADLSVANLPTAAAVTAGTFTVAGQQISVALTDSLQDVFDAISTATSGQVTARYNHGSDRITLTQASGELVLGGGNDTSNFLAVMKLTNSGGAATTSSAALGSVKATATLANAGLRSAVTAVDADGAGSFTVNGVTVAYNLRTDTLNSVISRINDAGAGVIASYDSANDRVTLSNKGTGDVGITASEASGGLLDALGLSSAVGGILIHGQNAQVKLNGGDMLSSTSNTLDASVHGVAGLSVTINTGSKQTLQVESDTAVMGSAIDDFITKFNAVQDIIEEKTKITVSGSSVAGSVLSGNREVEAWASRLRALAFDAVGGLTGDITRLDSIGIDFDSTTGHLKVKDTGKLATALSDKSEGVEALFIKPTTGLVSRFYSYLTDLKSASRTQTSNMTKANSDLDTQIATLEARLVQQRETLTSAFIRMLDAQSTAQSQNTYLTNTFFKDTSNN